MFRVLSGMLLSALTFGVSAQVTEMPPTPPVLEFEQVEDIRAAVSSTNRSISNVMRDAHRNPQATLEFFAITKDQTVLEIWPGAGWYTEILAPLVRDEGHFIAAHFDPESSVEFFRTSRESYETKLQRAPHAYGKVELRTLNFDPELSIAEPGSVDRVLTFRNVHNWLSVGMDETRLVFAKMHAALKPGGMLGLVEHRAHAGADLETMIKTGYVTEQLVLELAEEAGFQFVSRSPVNQNAQDNKDHPEGVWTLPPTLRLGNENRAHYMAVGESDRMTLLFVKPE